MGETIDWDAATGGDYIALEEGVPKTLVLGNWRPQDKFKDDKTKEIRPGVEFDASEEDGKELKPIKSWTVTAKGALKLLRPICEKADASGTQNIKVTVVAIGKGTERKYSIKSVE